MQEVFEVESKGGLRVGPVQAGPSSHSPPPPDVEEPSINLSHAFDQFVGAQLDSHTDHSLRIKPTLRQHADASVHTPLQRLRRLQAEAQQLAEELAAHEAEADSSAYVGQEVVRLQAQLNALQTDPSTQSQLYPKGDGPVNASAQRGLEQKLLSTLASVTSDGGPASDSKPLSGATEGQSPITYELFYQPGLSEDLRVERIGAVESRLAHIEAVVGTNTESIGNANAWELLTSLQERIALLDPARMQLIATRVQETQASVDKLLQQKAGTEDDEVDPSKVRRIFDLMTKWDAIVDTLPSLVDRLQSLRELHEECAQVSSTLVAVERDQSQVAALLQTNGEMMAQLDASMKANAGQMQANVDALQKRFHALEEKMTKLQ